MAFPAPAAPETPPSTGVSVSAAEPEGVLRLSEALAAALVSNPDIAAFSRRVRAAEAHTLQRGLRPNPALRVELEDFGGSGELGAFDGSELTIGLSQLVELAGKRLARTREARWATTAAEWSYQAKRVDVLTKTTQAFVRVLGAQEHVALADEAVALARDLVAGVNSRVVAGSTSAVERTKAEVALANAEVEHGERRRALGAARQQLAAMWGSHAPTFARVEGELGEQGSIPPLADLVARLERNPVLARWAAIAAQREATLALARARAIPDLTLAAGYRRVQGSDDNGLVVGISVPLPIFDRNQGAILEATHEAARAQAAGQASAVRLHAALAAAYETLVNAQRQSETLRTRVLPGATRVFTVLKSGYREGRFSYLDLLDAQRTLLQARAQHVDALVKYHQALAAVERLLGEPLAGPRRRAEQASR